MSKVKCRKKSEWRMPNDERRFLFVLCHLNFFRHLSFDICHFPAPCLSASVVMYLPQRAQNRHGNNKKFGRGRRGAG